MSIDSFLLAGAIAIQDRKSINSGDNLSMWIFMMYRELRIKLVVIRFRISDQISATIVIAFGSVHEPDHSRLCLRSGLQPQEVPGQG